MDTLDLERDVSLLASMAAGEIEKARLKENSDLSLVEQLIAVLSKWFPPDPENPDKRRYSFISLCRAKRIVGSDRDIKTDELFIIALFLERVDFLRWLTADSEESLLVQGRDLCLTVNKHTFKN